MKCNVYMAKHVSIFHYNVDEILKILENIACQSSCHKVYYRGS